MSSQYTRRRGDKNTYSGWLVISEDGAMELFRQEPKKIKKNQRKLRVNLTVPTAIFQSHELLLNIRLGGGYALEAGSPSP